MFSAHALIKHRGTRTVSGLLGTATPLPVAPDRDPVPASTPLTGRIQRLFQRVRAFDRRRPAVWNGTLATFWVLFAVLDVSTGGWRTVAVDRQVPEPLVLAMSIAFSAPLLWRRTHPLLVLAFMAPFSLVNVWTGAVVQASLLQEIVVFTIAVRLPMRTLAWSGALLATPLVIASGRFPDGWGRLVLPHVWMFAIAALAGILVRTRKEYTEALVDRAARLERERDQQARLAAAAERTRIAREMHDIIGHNLSVITGLADGGSYAAARSPERAAQALDAIGTTSRQALAELRRLLGVLHDQPEEADRTPQPTLDDIDALLEGVRRAGLPVRLDVQGTPPGQPPSPGRQLTTYRVVQESLTNTLKHAGASPSLTAEVTLIHRPGALEALITDNGTSRPDGRTPAPAGRGITGMRARASLYDGTLEAGPSAERGWQVRLRLPLEDSS
ncbi:signal transduction histidine kinase [Streptomyces sp. KhCrAH-43]|uniref:sensor histidine kinase n=1 Tax=unclassified Streptomyces TaxID=2593676 RepID=UPI0003698798|nr:MULTISPECIES: histidine kinase [unclassified Streptomyces]MYS38974.1 two-component sensor histidine kinase [Streptomyces sp. SID4920]MYX67166.1 two-component sensor histidine kinase [Streptomyces sp. SID8373]RAJ68669.1 signal transduction histidine kinase [Streptomyces sp. KhCrAH-43]